MARLIVTIVFEDAIGDLAGDDYAVFQSTNSIDWLSDIAMTLSEMDEADRPRICIITKRPIIGGLPWWRQPLRKRRAIRAWLHRKGVCGIEEFEFPLFAPKAHLRIDRVSLQRFFDTEAPRPEWLVGLDPLGLGPKRLGPPPNRDVSGTEGKGDING